MMERLELIFESEEMFNAELVRETLSGLDLHYKSMKRIGIDPPKPPKKCCGQGKKQSPPMLKKIKNYKETMVRWYKAGRPIVDIRELAERLAICGGCASLKGYECTECGCPMDNKAKMDIDNLCELNKW